MITVDWKISSGLTTYEGFCRELNDIVGYELAVKIADETEWTVEAKIGEINGSVVELRNLYYDNKQ